MQATRVVVCEKGAVATKGRYQERTRKGFGHVRWSSPSRYRPV
jgi:hypothetical protein